MYEPLASGIWNDLKKRFAQTNAPRVFELRRDIALHSQANLSISAYFTKLKSYWDELYSYLPILPCTCGSSKALHDYQQQERLTQFLMGLHESYSNIRGQILLMDPLPSVSRAYSLFLQEEKQRQVTTTSITPESAAYAAASFAPSQQRQVMTTSITPESGAYAAASFAPSRQSAGHEKSRGRRTRPTCDHCNWVGHTKEHCYLLVGYPPGHRLHQPGNQSSGNVASTNTSHAMSSITPEQVEQLLSLLKDRSANPIAHFASNSISHHQPITWIVDTGASDHMIHDHSLFDSAQPNTGMPPVKLPNGSYAEVTHVGDVYLTPSIKLNNVLCVPSFGYNLLSISKLTASNPISAIFTHDSCLFQDQSQKMMIGVAKQHGGLYYFKPSQNSSIVLNSVLPTFDLWHWRLGHVSFPHNSPSYASESTPNEPDDPDLNEPPHIQSLDPPTSTHVPLDSVAQPLRRSTRSHRPPAHLQDFHCSHAHLHATPVSSSTAQSGKDDE
ncbi:hypothetical protein RHGRI_020360 [Rhododendron griersonianum]|uniref:Retrovirus-related Pol polyprotein from transposon TNT 1-94-like beta-barrel domain-containing protein n=1 Tax=Rhododendron griersonianum TaxID=479676 RepID=A0AAV6JFW1_9ERIC|nr:hypothetical protein RHGRI_020360 [Rhododendron griersonianum]